MTSHDIAAPGQNDGYDVLLDTSSSQFSSLKSVYTAQITCIVVSSHAVETIVQILIQLYNARVFHM